MTVSRESLLPARAVVASVLPLLLPQLLLLLVFASDATTAAAISQDAVAADEDLMNASPLTVARCRAGCLHKLVPRDVEATECEKKSDCWKCWKYCEVLQTEGKNMKNICEHNCDAGCREACSFHDWRGGSQPSPVVEARGERALTIESGTLRWPRPAAMAGPFSVSPRLVYVIMRRREPGTRRMWSQLGQTAGYNARLPETTAPCTVRVLAVSAEGLVTIYSPAVRTPADAATSSASVTPSPSPSPPSSSPAAAVSLLHDLRDADVIIRSLGRDQILGIRLPLAARSAPQEESLRLMGDDPSDSSEVWNLREVSMIHQKVLVIAEVAWDARQVHRPAYLVTWEIVGGGLKGNLFTDTTCVTLSLWPDTAYLIQVSLLGGADESVKMSTSPTLLLDTRSAVQSTPTRTTPPTTTTTPLTTRTTTTTTRTTVVTTAAAEEPTTDAEGIVDDGWSDDVTGGLEIAGGDGATAAEEDVTAELTAPVAVAAGLGRAEWQLLAVAGAGAAVLLLLALVVAYRRTGRGSPALRKVVQHDDDAECPPLLDYAPARPLDFAKYLGRCRKSHQLLDDDTVSYEESRVTQARH